MKIVFLFSGQGSHYFQMGKSLYDAEPVFRDKLMELDSTASRLQGFSILEKLYDPGQRIFDPFLPLAYTHPAIFMVEIALAKMLADKGIFPDYLAGFSLGEFTAAALAGVLTEEQALELVIGQARIISHACTEGGMIAVLHNSNVYDEIPEIRRNCTVASHNGPAQFVVAGEKKSLEAAKKAMKDNGILHQELMVSYGFHSPAIDAGRDSYCSYLRGRTLGKPRIPLVSGVSGGWHENIPEQYFWDTVRQPIRFAEAIQSLETSCGRQDQLVYIDAGPAGSLANLIKYNIPEGSPSKGFQIMSPFRQEQRNLAALCQYFATDRTSAPASNFALSANSATPSNPATPSKAAPPSIKRSGRLLAYVFPGQGSQRKGMGEGLFDQFPELTRQADSILGYSVKELCLENSNRLLNLTQYTQPALFVVNALSWLKLKEDNGITPDFLAGHSLGEYNALFAAGAIDFGTGLRLVRKRGELMAGMKEGGMAAVKGLSEEEITQVIERHQLQELDIANYNSYNQVVLSGPRSIIATAGPHFEAAGATLYFPLNVSGAFHSRYMDPAKKDFTEFLRQFHFSAPAIPVVSNVEASPYAADAITPLLALQLVKPVRWAESVRYLLNQGEMTIREVGPGDVLTKLVYSIQRDTAETVN